MKPGVTAVSLVLLVSACAGRTTSHAQCAASGVRVDVSGLPSRWVERGTFTLCRDEICSTQRSPFTAFYGRGPFLARNVAEQTPVVVTLRVEVDGVQVVRAGTSGKVRPSPAQHGELTEICGGLTTLRVSRDHTTLDEQSSS